MADQIDSPKVPLQLSLDSSLRNRLKRLSRHTGIPMSRIVSDLLRDRLPELESKHGVQEELSL